MAPPTYGDLGKAARDLFSKGFSEYFVIVYVSLYYLLKSSQAGLWKCLVELVPFS